MVGRGLLVLLAGALLALVGACADDGTPEGDRPPDEGLRVGSFDFAESELLAELYAQAAESIGIPVVRVGRIGPREITAPALELGHVDLVPEYVGTASRFFGTSDIASDAEVARLDLIERLTERGMTAMGLSPAEDVNVVAVARETAEELELGAVSDLRGLAATLRFGGPPECPERDLCLRGLESLYGLAFAEFVAQPSLAFTVEALRRDEIDVGLLFSTSAELEDSGLVVLLDDLGLQPPENVVPVVRLDALDRWGPELVEVADSISGALTTDELRTLNRRVADGDGMEEVAAEWLLTHISVEHDRDPTP